MEDKKYTYTATDFARYHEGKMAPAEMHALEKAAMEDPFLADALEGYTHTSSAISDVDDLRFSLKEKTNSKKGLFTSTSHKNIWWRVAAIFFLIGIGGYFLFNDAGKEDRSIAGFETSEGQHQIARAEVNESNNQSVESPLKDKTGETNLQADKKQAPVASTNRNQSEIKPSTPSAATPTNKAETNPEKARQPATSSSPELSEKAAGLPDTAHISDSGNIISVFAGKAESQNPMPSVKMAKRLEGVQSATYANRKHNDSPKLSLKEKIDTRQGEVVMIAKPAPAIEGKIKDFSHIQTEKKYSLFEIPEESGLQPKDGPDHLQDYLIKTRKPVRNAINQPVHGKVKLHFSTNESGNPEQISILSSDCPECEPHAIEIIKNGPAWKVTGKENKGTIILIF